MDSGIREIFACGIQNLRKLACGIRNPESGKILLVESGIQNPSSTDKYWNPLNVIQNPQRGVQSPRLSWIPLHGAKRRQWAIVAGGCTLTSRKKTAVANRFNDRFKTAFFLSATTPSTFCKPGHFRCGSSTICIDDSKVCDKHPDCPHGEDETKCGKYKRTWQLAVNSPLLPPPLPWAVGGRGEGEGKWMLKTRISLWAFHSRPNPHRLNAYWQVNQFNLILGKNSYFSLDKIPYHWLIQVVTIPEKP